MGCSWARAILLVHPVTLRELKPSPRAQDQLGWPTFDGASRKPLTGAIIMFWVLGLFAQWEPVRGCFGRSLRASRLIGAYSEALGSYPLSRGAGSTHPAGDVSVGSRPRSLYRPEAIVEHGGIVRPIGAERPGALTMAVRPCLAAQALEGDSRCARSQPVARGSCTCGRSVMGDRSVWSQRAEAVAIAVGINALADR